MSEEQTNGNDLLYIQANLVAPKNRTKDGLNYSYRNCEDILKAAKPLLDERDCTLIITDEIIVLGMGEQARFYVKSTAVFRDSKNNMFTSTGLARETLIPKGMSEPQSTGSTSSYARKYALGGLFLLDDSEDPDSLVNVTEAEIEMYADLVENGDGAKLFLMQLNQRDKYMALHKSAAPKGKKTAFRQQVSDLIMEACATSQLVEERILELVEAGDNMGIQEVVEELSKDEKTMVWRGFSDDQQKTVTDLLKPDGE